MQLLQKAMEVALTNDFSNEEDEEDALNYYTALRTNLIECLVATFNKLEEYKLADTFFSEVPAVVKFVNEINRAEYLANQVSHLI